jgi:hypothetical protein
MADVTAPISPIGGALEQVRAVAETAPLSSYPKSCPG